MVEKGKKQIAKQANSTNTVLNGYLLLPLLHEQWRRNEFESG